jgi:hypothetical protein
MRPPLPAPVKKAFFLSSLSTDQLNYLNIGLMLAAAVAAFVKPFEVFLFVYALLGPLHYLTEISWLHDRKYFTRGRNDYLVLVAFAGIISIIDMGIVPGIPAWLRVAVTYLAFGSALVFVLVSKAWPRLVCYAALVATTGLVIRIDFLQSLFSVLLPTIVHVLVFTGLFILVGALKNRSVSGISSLVVFGFCSLSFFVLGRAKPTDDVGGYVQKTYLVFAQLNYSLMTPFSQHNLNVPANITEYVKYINTVLYHSPTALAVMGLIAFAYTYHYFNWFSKTSIIQWHNIPRPRFIAVIVIWLASIVAYAYDYRFGLRWLFFLSLTHVLLEFPLNHLTIINIGKEFKTIVSPEAALRRPEKA